MVALTILQLCFDVYIATSRAWSVDARMVQVTLSSGNANSPPPPPPVAPHIKLSVGMHKNIIEVACLNDLEGSEGLLMEVAVCDLYRACLKQTNPAFNLEQQIK